MAYEIATLTKGTGDDCHYQFINAVRVLAEANGWTTLRFDTSTDNHEWIGQSAGSGSEQIFVGLKTYQNSGLDYYNFNCATFVGYLSSNSFEAQPGAFIRGCQGHNNAITYYLNINPRRIVAGLKVGTPVYTHFYIGKFLAYFRPEIYPLPICCGGMLSQSSGTRFSDGGGWSYSAMVIRQLDGVYSGKSVLPFSTAQTGEIRNLYANNQIMSFPADFDGNSTYQLEPLEMHDLSNTYGALEGVFGVSGFNNNSDNVLQEGGSSVVDQTGLSVEQAVSQILTVGGRAFIVLQNRSSTSFNSYIALEMN